MTHNIEDISFVLWLYDCSAKDAPLSFQIDNETCVRTLDVNKRENRVVEICRVLITETRRKRKTRYHTVCPGCA